MVIKDPKNKDFTQMSREELIAIAEHYDRYAEKRKTETISMRVTPRMKREIKAAAEKNGYSKYQKWVQDVIFKAVEQTFPEQYSDSGDDF